MKATKFAAKSGFLSIMALLFFMPICASAQLPNGWYEIVRANQLTVRNAQSKYVMGTLLSKNANGQPDRFHIQYMKPGKRWAWGYAQGEVFKGCGWVHTFKNDQLRSLKRMENQPSRPPSCSRYATKTTYVVPPSSFASQFSDRMYTNSTPSVDGSGANIIKYDTKDEKASVYVYGNYVGGVAKTRLNRDASGTPQPLGPNHRVCWRYFSLDRKFVMVNFKGICRETETKEGERKPLASGKWGFVRCKDVVPSPKPLDHKDRAKFNSVCFRTP